MHDEPTEAEKGEALGCAWAAFGLSIVLGLLYAGLVAIGFPIHEFGWWSVGALVLAGALFGFWRWLKRRN
jgi:hypothetical protein